MQLRDVQELKDILKLAELEITKLRFENEHLATRIDMFDKMWAMIDSNSISIRKGLMSAGQPDALYAVKTGIKIADTSLNDPITSEKASSTPV